MSSDLKYLHPQTRADLHNAIVAAGLRLVVVQTFGDAAQSAGTHGVSGRYLNEHGEQQIYAGAIDWSVNQEAVRIDPKTFKDRGRVEMTDARIRWWLWKCAENNIAAFYRRTWQGFEARHIHGISCSVTLLPILQRQVVEWLTGEDGLKGDADETYWQPPDSTRERLKTAFLQHHPQWRARLE